MKLRKFFKGMLILFFFSAGCLGASEKDTNGAATDEVPENAMDDETKEEFDLLMEEFKRTGKMPEQLSEMSSTPIAPVTTSPPAKDSAPTTENNSSS